MSKRKDARQGLRTQRRALSLAERNHLAAELADKLVTHPLFVNSQHIAAYLPVDGEVDPLPLMLRAWEMGKIVYLPVLVPFNHNRLWFARYEPGDALVRNRFGIPEPARIHRERSAAIGLDLVLAPLVGFDKKGNRLGMGGGFYDRSFEFLNRRRQWCKPRLIGLAYEFQKLKNLPQEPWDVPLHAVVTERKLRVIKR